MVKNGKKNSFLSVLTVFSDLWDDEKTYPQSPLSRPIVVLCEHNAKGILNLALSNVQENCTKVYANLRIFNTLSDSVFWKG